MRVCLCHAVLRKCDMLSALLRTKRPPQNADAQWVDCRLARAAERKQSVRESYHLWGHSHERKYFHERFKFWQFGDPFIEKRKLQARRSGYVAD